MHILVNYGGEYEDAWETNMACSSDEAYLTTVKADYERRTETTNRNQALILKHMRAWHVQHPQEMCPRLKPLPHSHTKKAQMTPEMRLERIEVEAENQRMTVEMQIATRKRFNAMTAERQAFIQSLKLTPQELNDLDALQQESQYRVETIPLLTAISE